MKWFSDQTIAHLSEVANAPDFQATKYTLIRQLGRGGMATVYLALDEELQREVAIKVINIPDLNVDTISRMIREARIISQLEHPGIVPVHDVGTLDDSRVYYVMKLVRGQRLDEYVAQQSSLNDRLRKFHLTCEAVAFAHAHSVIHRDLKPQNIMIGSFGEVLVLDWGVAKILRPDTVEFGPTNGGGTIDVTTDTAHGTIIGTRHFMSPEQTRGEIAELDQRTDVYSLGAILYLLLTNELPGLNENRGVTRPREINRKISKAAEAICQKAIAQQKNDRYAGAKELAADIEKLIDNHPVSAYRENLFERLQRWVSKNRLLIFLILAYIVMRLFFIVTARR